VKVAIFSRYPKDSEHPRGGVEAVTVVLVKALAQLGDLDVHVLTLERGRDSTAVEHEGALTIHRLPRSSWPEVLDIFVGPGRRRLLQYVQALKPDVLHTHETFGLALGNIGIPHVFTMHGFDHANLLADSARHAWIRSQLWRCAERRGLSTQKHIISITPYVRTMIEPQTNAHIYDIDNPVDERFFQIERRPEPGRILCVGWINERKNTLGSVEAFACIADRFPEARLIIAGEANEAEYLDRVMRSVEHHEIGPQVEMPGHIDHVLLMEELAKASVFLLPSRQENSPMAIAEAMAAGIPAVAADRCGMPHMVEEGRTGFLVDPESTEQIAQRLYQLVDSPQLCRQMGQAASQLARDRFHPFAVAQRTRTVYRQVCEIGSSTDSTGSGIEVQRWTTG
jgi:glycosyltransferase involved in cell wall biosynthesis